jgi:hypothetical protein
MQQRHCVVLTGYDGVESFFDDLLELVQLKFVDSIPKAPHQTDDCLAFIACDHSTCRQCCDDVMSKQYGAPAQPPALHSTCRHFASDYLKSTVTSSHGRLKHRLAGAADMDKIAVVRRCIR